MAQAYATQDFMTSRIPEIAAIAAIDADAPNAALADAQVEIDLDTYGARADIAHALAAAHFLALAFPATLGGENGIPSAKSAGEVSVSYATPPMDRGDSFWKSTRFGRLFEHHQRIAGATCRVIG